MRALLEAHRDIALADHHVRDRIDKVAEDVLALGGRVAIAEPLTEQPVRIGYQGPAGTAEPRSGCSVGLRWNLATPRMEA